MINICKVQANGENSAFVVPFKESKNSQTIVKWPVQFTRWPQLACGGVSGTPRMQGFSTHV